MSTLAFISERLNEVSTIVDQLKEEVERLIRQSGDHSFTPLTPRALDFDSILGDSGIERSRPTPASVPVRPNRVIWTEAETVAFLDCLRRGMENAEIARLLNEIPQQVREKRKTENRKNL